MTVIVIVFAVVAFPNLVSHGREATERQVSPQTQHFETDGPK